MEQAHALNRRRAGSMKCNVLPLTVMIRDTGSNSSDNT
jgi:hypothetical protein